MSSTNGYMTVLNEYIEVNPKKMGGTPVFRGTRIPLWILFEYLEGGKSVEDFLNTYDGIDPDTVYGFVRALRKGYTNEEVSA